MRINFICHMLVLLAIMLGVSLAINAKFFTMAVLWGAFVYIIAKEFVDEWRLSRRERKDAALKAEIVAKLDRATEQIKQII